MEYLKMTPFHAWNEYTDEVRKIVDEYGAMRDRYESIFGDKSLERVMQPDPIDTTLEAYLDFTDELEQAIEDNKPLRQADPEIWKSIIF